MSGLGALPIVLCCLGFPVVVLFDYANTGRALALIKGAV